MYVGICCIGRGFAITLLVGVWCVLIEHAPTTPRPAMTTVKAFSHNNYYIYRGLVSTIINGATSVIQACCMNVALY